jgi:hypothetical protein
MTEVPRKFGGPEKQRSLAPLNSCTIAISTFFFSRHESVPTGNNVPSRYSSDCQPGVREFSKFDSIKQRSFTLSLFRILLLLLLARKITLFVIHFKMT